MPAPGVVSVYLKIKGTCYGNISGTDTLKDQIGNKTILPLR